VTTGRRSRTDHLNWIDSDQNGPTFLQLLSPNSNEKILDVGAGKGMIAALVQRSGGSEVHALDPNKKRIAFVKENHPELITCLSGSDSIPYPDGFFDKVYSTMAVHHFPDQQKSFREFGRVIKPGGVLVIVEIAPHTLLGRLARFFENVILRSHLSFLGTDELAELLRQNGDFEIREKKQISSLYFVQAERGRNAPRAPDLRAPGQHLALGPY
jgi:ubiquinone/menaquinone biosynthesis C-methylase UbiE